MRTGAQFENVLALIELGRSDPEIARTTGIPRRTVNGWRRPESRPRRKARWSPPSAPWRPPDPETYAYLLGAYLGDGHVALVRHPFLRVSLDAKYPYIVDEVRSAMGGTFAPARAVVIGSIPGNSIVVQLSHARLLEAFPQAARGPKHLREIRLADWQSECTHAHPKALLRGLIHSDGSRCQNRFRVPLANDRVGHYSYPRYFFTNASQDIRDIFCEHCELLGTRWTQSNPRNISVSHRHSVACLDSFVGPKA